MKEASIHYQVAQYLKHAYPTVIFRTDFAAGIKLTMGQAIKHKSLQSSRAYPDIFIAHPRGGYYGLYIELKQEGVKLKRDKDGKKLLDGDYKIRKAGDWFDLHIEEQANMLDRLRMLGYVAKFACGFEEARKLIDSYMEL